MEALGAAQRELETLALLARELPDDYTVFHGIHWTRVEHGTALFGEIDFAIVPRAGDCWSSSRSPAFWMKPAKASSNATATPKRRSPCN